MGFGAIASALALAIHLLNPEPFSTYKRHTAKLRQDQRLIYSYTYIVHPYVRNVYRIDRDIYNKYKYTTLLGLAQIEPY